MRAATFGLILALALWSVPSAWAHANYSSSDPDRGARLDVAPDRVTVTLSEPIDPRGSALEVHDADRQPVHEGPVTITEGATPTLTVRVRPELPPGAYLVTWKALSTVDGHVTGGSFGFAVGHFEPPEGSPDLVDYDPASATARAVAYAGYALAFGALAFSAYVHPAGADPARARRYARLLLCGTGLILAGVTALYLLTWNEIALPWASFHATEVGHAFAWRVAFAFAGVLAAAWAVASLTGRRPLLGVLVTLLASAAGSSRFAHSADRGTWAIGIDFLHLVSVATWIGGLALFLGFLLETRRTGTFDEVLPTGRRFSRVALTSVIVLGATGLASSLVILGPGALRDPFSLWSTPYGGILGAKVLLFGLMVGLAGINRFIFLGHQPGPDAAPPALARLVGALFPHGPGRTKAFERAVGLEATLGLLILVLAGFLTALSPPVDAPGSEDALRAAGSGRAHDVALTFRPAPRAGETTNLTLFVRTSNDGAPLTDAVRVRVTLDRAGENATGGTTYVATHRDQGWWTAGDPLLAQGGAYEALVEIQTVDVYRDRVRIPFRVSEPSSLRTTYDVFLHEAPFHIAPEVIPGRPGEPIRLRVHNTGEQLHDWILCPDAACATPLSRSPLLPENATATLDLVLPGAGTYEYYCSVPGHKEAGMRGQLLVEETNAQAPGVGLTALLGILALAAIAWRRR